MRRARFITVGTLSLILLLLANERSQPQSAQTTPKQTQSGQSQQVKARRILVKELPRELEGITLKNGVFKLKPGYKFVPQSVDTVSIALQAGSGTLSGRFVCECAGNGGATSGTCAVITDKSILSCGKLKGNPCSGECRLTVLTTGNGVRLAIF